MTTPTTMITNLDTLPEALIIEEVMDVLRIGRTTAYALIRAGDIPCVRVGRQIRVNKADLAKFMGLTLKC